MQLSRKLSLNLHLYFPIPSSYEYIRQYFCVFYDNHFTDVVVLTTTVSSYYYTYQQQQQQQRPKRRKKKKKVCYYDFRQHFFRHTRTVERIEKCLCKCRLNVFVNIVLQLLIFGKIAFYKNIEMMQICKECNLLENEQLKQNIHKHIESKLTWVFSYTFFVWIYSRVLLCLLW